MSAGDEAIPEGVTVRLHRSLYLTGAIREAAETFADFARFTFRRDGDYTVVELREIPEDVQGDVAAEFCNFALANSAVRRKGASA